MTPSITKPPYSLDDINTLILEKTGCSIDELTPDVDIERDLGCTGDDFDELMVQYAKKFNVDMSSYKWYFHAAEEGASNTIGSMFFKTPVERVNHIPVTPALLWKSGKWLVDYPPHTLPWSQI